MRALSPLPQFSPHAREVNEHLVAARKAQFRATLRRLVDPARPVALVEFPGSGNPGDAAIWLGESRVLAQEGLDVAYMAHLRDVSARTLRRRVGSGTILLHGGGNLGDLYPEHQELRESIAERLPRQRIVQLPQSIHFTGAAAIERSRRRFGSHEQLTLLARDETSLAFAREHYACRSELCPDAAFALGPLRPAAEPPEARVLWMSRVDPERAHQPPTDPSVPVTDWYTGLFKRKAWRAEQALRRGAVASLMAVAPLRRAAPVPWPRLLDPLALPVMRSGLAVLGRGAVIVTDRLHAHILCVMLGKPHVVLDNSYGKLTRFRRAWTAEAAGVEVAATPAQALERARAMADALDAGSR